MNYLIQFLQRLDVLEHLLIQENYISNPLSGGKVV